MSVVSRFVHAGPVTVCHDGDEPAGMPNRSLLIEWRKRWNRSLFQFLRRRVRSSVDVQDLAQETYLRLFRARDLDEVRNPLAYLLQVASHVALEWCDQQPRGDVGWPRTSAEELVRNALAAPDDSDPPDPPALSSEARRRASSSGAAMGSRSGGICLSSRRTGLVAHAFASRRVPDEGRRAALGTGRIEIRSPSLRYFHAGRLRGLHCSVTRPLPHANQSC